MLKNNIHFEVLERKLMLGAIDMIMVVLGLFLLGLMVDRPYLEIRWGNSIAIIVLLVYLIIFGTVFEIYNLHKSNELDVTFKTIVITVATASLFYFLTPLLPLTLPEKRLQIVYFYFTIVISIFLWRLIYISLISSPRFYKKVLLVGEVNHIDSFVKALSLSDPNYKIVGFVNCELSKEEDSIKLKSLKEYRADQMLQVIDAEGISEVVVASYNSDTITAEIYNDFMILLDRGFSVREYSQVYEEMTKRVPIQFIGKDFYRFFPFSRSNSNTLYLFARRLFDILFAVIGLIIGVIITPFVLIGNYLGNRGPLFYKQERVGKNGKLFKIIKLRSMIVNAETDGAKWAQVNDVRITKFGKFLRKSRIDEVPQFINIIKGDMSIIGPRPERLVFVSELAQVIPFYETRHIIKPGLTGWAQVKMHYGGSVEDSLFKLQYDLYYIKHRSVFLDLNIMMKTFSTVLFFRGQ